MESKRQSRVARLLQKELSSYFLFHQKSFGAMITVTVVRVSPDLSLAKSYISIFTNGSKDIVFDRIQQQLPAIRRTISENVRYQLRRLPEVTFFIDDSLDYVEHIEALLKK